MRLFLLSALLAMLAASTNAIPLERQQVPMPAKLEHVLEQPKISPDEFSRPLVVKNPSLEEFKAKVLAATAANRPVSQPLIPGRKTSSWIRVQAIKDELARKMREDPKACFCAGGSICCHGAEGMNCNFGVCGLGS
ncbi:uncharacterized protein E0L32_004011 [Thyridium curvatum]|uniref:Uncharacterized protein n=1 Tax=Thyridium curvatum TaxID=1093900 RepID=A0A507B253_9PEZI|nr:uncharacterized protein E0L32_004011 [Thyridium curvatum]TPX16362.1 hypothetical protein E0L32_004011 [Thyridium curvatum]